MMTHVGLEHLLAGRNVSFGHWAIRSFVEVCIVCALRYAHSLASLTHSLAPELSGKIRMMHMTLSVCKLNTSIFKGFLLIVRRRRRNWMRNFLGFPFAQHRSYRKLLLSEMILAISAPMPFSPLPKMRAREKNTGSAL